MSCQSYSKLQVLWTTRTWSWRRPSCSTATSASTLSGKLLRQELQRDVEEYPKRSDRRKSSKISWKILSTGKRLHRHRRKVFGGEVAPWSWKNRQGTVPEFSEEIADRTDSGSIRTKSFEQHLRPGSVGRQWPRWGRYPGTLGKVRSGAGRCLWIASRVPCQWAAERGFRWKVGPASACFIVYFKQDWAIYRSGCLYQSFLIQNKMINKPIPIPILIIGSFWSFGDQNGPIFYRFVFAKGQTIKTDDIIPVYFGHWTVDRNKPIW